VGSALPADGGNKNGSFARSLGCGVALTFVAITNTTFDLLWPMLAHTGRLEPQLTQALDLVGFIWQCAFEQHQDRMHQSFKRHATA
jgi:hypothetical protein